MLTQGGLSVTLYMFETVQLVKLKNEHGLNSKFPAVPADIWGFFVCSQLLNFGYQRLNTSGGKYFVHKI